ncbi:MAG: hypothetical protein M3282_06140 [Gemmatimonadota bacterium]|nr:hypothetical protein [Gemmatimonadota bacterium]
MVSPVDLKPFTIEAARAVRTRRAALLVRRDRERFSGTILFIGKIVATPS